MATASESKKQLNQENRTLSRIRLLDSLSRSWTVTYRLSSWTKCIRLRVGIKCGGEGANAGYGVWRVGRVFQFAAYTIADDTLTIRLLNADRVNRDAQLTAELAKAITDNQQTDWGQPSNGKSSCAEGVEAGRVEAWQGN